MGYYLFAILDDVKTWLGIFTALSGFFTGLFGVMQCIQQVTVLDSSSYTLENNKKFLELLKKWFKISITVFIIMFTFSTFLPSQKQLAFVIAAPYIVENQQLQEAGKNSAEILKLGTEFVKDVLTTATAKKGE